MFRMAVFAFVGTFLLIDTFSPIGSEPMWQVGRDWVMNLTKTPGDQQQASQDSDEACGYRAMGSLFTKSSGSGCGTQHATHSSGSGHVQFKGNTMKLKF